jgi:hypothetical protein
MVGNRFHHWFCTKINRVPTDRSNDARVLVPSYEAVTSKFSYHVHEHLDEAGVVHDHNNGLPRRLGSELRRLGTHAPGERPSILLLVERHRSDAVNDGRDPERLTQLSHLHQLLHGGNCELHHQRLVDPGDGALVELGHVPAVEVVVGGRGRRRVRQCGGGDVGAGGGGGGLADVLGGDGGDAVDLVAEARVLEAELLLVEGQLADQGGGRTAAAGAGGVGQGVLVPRVLGAQLVVLRAQVCVLLPLRLRLRCTVRYLENVATTQTRAW